VLARDALVVVQGAVELERLEEAAERRFIDRVRSLDDFAAAEVGADGVDHRLPCGPPVIRHRHASAPTSSSAAMRSSS
jgi:hypothetical protein